MNKPLYVAKERNENTVLFETRKLFDESEYGLVAVDGSHLNDIGMFRVANALTKILLDDEKKRKN